MLRTLRLRDFVLIDSVDLDLGPGFTVLTGETGAGKSILLDALGLLLGDRPEPGVVRSGARRADLTAEFDACPASAALLAEWEIPVDDSALILRRIIECDGRSRVQINGHPGRVTQLRALGEVLADIHGQHAALALTRPDAQRALLDRHGQLELPAQAARQAWLGWSAAREALHAAQQRQATAHERLDLLSEQHELLLALDPQPGEWEARSAEQHRLAHARELIDEASQLSDALAQGDDALARTLRALRQRTQSLCARFAPAQAPTTPEPTGSGEPAAVGGLAGASELLESAYFQVVEAARLLAAEALHTDLDPERLEETEARMSALFNAARRLRVAPGELPAHRVQLESDLASLQGPDLAELEAREAMAARSYRELASSLSARRTDCAEPLAAAVTSLLQRLGMAPCQFEIAVEPTEPGPNGVDGVEFRLRSHPEAMPRPIARTASGGELSRIGLALAVATIHAGPQVPVLVFDEADAGIGGTVANVVGELLQQLGRHHQVLCVTHLAQVAARADQQFVVRRAGFESDPAAAQAPRSVIEALSPEDRVGEIARMLGARSPTAYPIAFAAEMLGAVAQTTQEAGKEVGKEAGKPSRSANGLVGRTQYRPASERATA